MPAIERKGLAITGFGQLRAALLTKNISYVSDGVGQPEHFALSAAENRRFLIMLPGCVHAAEVFVNLPQARQRLCQLNSGACLTTERDRLHQARLRVIEPIFSTCLQRLQQKVVRFG